MELWHALSSLVDIPGIQARSQRLVIPSMTRKGWTVSDQGERPLLRQLRALHLPAIGAGDRADADREVTLYARPRIALGSLNERAGVGRSRYS